MHVTIKNWGRIFNYSRRIQIEHGIYCRISDIILLFTTQTIARFDQITFLQHKRFQMSNSTTNLQPKTANLQRRNYNLDFDYVGEARTITCEFFLEALRQELAPSSPKPPDSEPLFRSRTPEQPEASR